VDKYTIYEGRFPCKTCKKEVKTMRVYSLTGSASWMCPDKHLSEVELFKVGYKKKKTNE
jgi:deoxycytidylate deaminase